MVRAYTIYLYSDEENQYVRVYTIRINSDQGKAVWSELTQFANTLIRENSMVRAYTFRIYSDQGKQYGQSLHNLPLL